MFEAFREHDYRRFWTAQFISNIGGWMQAVAQGWLVYRLTDSAFLLGFVGFAASAPSIFLMLPGGVLADQLDRRRVIAASQWAQAASAMALAISIHLDRISVWQILAAALVVGIAQSFSAPAYQAMVLDLLDDRSRLPNAVAMNSLQFNLSRAIGPLLASIALSAWGSFWCFFLNAISFLPLIFILGRVRKRQQAHEGPREILTQLREGLRYVRKDRLVMMLLGAAAAGSLFGYPYLSLMPVLARKLFTNDAVGNGYLIGAIGAGALLAALVLSMITPPKHHMLAIIITAVIAFGVCLTTVAYVQSVIPVMALLVLCGAGMVASLALCNTMIQQRTPDSMRGRVMSMYTFSFFAFIPFGNLLSGMLAEQRGIAMALATLGCALIVVGVLLAIAGHRMSLATSSARR
ncbi:MAG TPA: MFS transporter [Thermoanaerobaculia bacterium]|jgi:MFS family permease|nr:MFS transporter [Thermoanaerobaculia bacterium]